MTKKERLLTVLSGKTADRVPVGFWFHFGGAQAHGKECVQAHLDFYRAVDTDFIKIMSDGLDYPIKLKVSKAEDWFKLAPLPKDDDFFTGTIERCRLLNQELNGDCCTFYNIFSPFNIIKERDVFTQDALVEKSFDKTIMKQLRENPEAIKYALDIIAGDMCYLVEKVISEGGCEGVYLSVQGAEIGRMSEQEYLQWITPSNLKVLDAANAASPNNILHMCCWAGDKNHLSYWRDYPAKVKHWGCDLEELSLTQGKEFFPGAVIMGGLDNRRGYTLYSGDKQQIQQAARKCIDEMEGYPYILAADCTVPADINFDNLRWVVEEIRK